MRIISHIGLTISMAVLLLPTLGLAQNPFSYMPLNTAPTVPTAVDIIVESNTYTPGFYQGRAEPVSGANIKLTAIAHKEISGSELTYKWYLEGKALAENPTKSARTATIVAPVNPNFTVKVDVFSATGKILATKTETIPLSKARLAFYENNPLRGLTRIAIANNLIMIGEEASIDAIPYFINRNDIGRDLKTFWEINNQEQAPLNPWQLVVERDQLERDATINFIMQNYRTLESTEKTITLKL